MWVSTVRSRLWSGAVQIRCINCPREKTRRGDSTTELHLPMSRTDIGNYLGITLETVCRELARLEKSGIISLHKRELAILDLPRLREPICEDPR